ncbi:hypothetical protein CAPTEDRAFT_108894, partial [Capitella teleta]
RIIHIISVILRFIGLVALLFFFICSLDLLSSAFTLIGGRSAGGAFSNPLIQNPICGLMIGVIATAFLQSSSTSTSITITMVASGLLDVPTAIPIIMGSNIGTSVTGILVSVTQAGDREVFRKAFSAATVHDMFNWLTVIILLPVEIMTGYLFHLTTVLVNAADLTTGGGDQKFLKVITEPFTDWIVQVDKKVLDDIATGKPGSNEASLLKIWCEYDIYNVTLNATNQASNASLSVRGEDQMFVYGRLLFHYMHRCICSISYVVPKLNYGSPFQVRICFKDQASIVTMLVQSSSVVASALTPLVGLGVVSVERVYPMMLGANIGTTSTAILAAFAASGDSIRASFQIAMCHLFFNLTGIIIWFPIPFMRRVPINLSKFLGNVTAQYRWFAVLYLLMMFFFIPLTIFALSIPGWYVLAAVGIPILLLLVAIGIINIIQNKKPNWLPAKMRTWEFLPEPMRSLKPLDRIVARVLGICTCCTCFRELPEDCKGNIILVVEPETENETETANNDQNGTRTQSESESVSGV